MSMIYITYVPTNYAQELDLIERLCKYEGYTVGIIYPHNPEYKTYYKGGHPAILIYEELDKDPTVFYGFWHFAGFLLKHGMIRC